jgi:hypothetical protein
MFRGPEPLKFPDVGIIQVPKYPHRSLLVATNLETIELLQSFNHRGKRLEILIFSQQLFRVAHVHGVRGSG